MNVVITGGTGFIGTYLAQRLVDAGHKVTVAGRAKSKDDLGVHVTYKCLDLNDKVECKRACEGHDVVIHCAGKAGAWGAYKDFYDANVVGTSHLLEGAKETTVGRFINISFPSLYFQMKDQFNLKEEEVPQKNYDAYGKTKYLAEKKVKEAHSADFLTLSLRPRGVIGAGDRNWLPRIIQMRKENRLVQVGKKDPLVDFTTLTNLGDVVELCLEARPETLGESYNITNGEPVHLWQFIDEALVGLGMDSKRKIVPRPVAMTVAYFTKFFHKLIRSSKEPAILPLKVGVASYSMTLNIEKAHQKLGYVPKRSTREGLQDFIQGY